MIYARSDVRSVHVGEAHGGCGQVHDRPADAAGNPVQPWGLACPSCEQFLRTDPMWSATVHEIPLSHDERSEQESARTRVNAEKDQIMLAALARIAGMELPASMSRPAVAAAPVAAMLACPQGHAQPAGHSFCGHCGAPMRGTVPAAAIGGKAA